MKIPSTVRTYLANSRAHFKGRETAVADTFEATLSLAGIPRHKVIKPVLLKSGKAFLMAIIRADQKVDIEKLDRLFRRKFTLCSEHDIAELMPNCDPNVLPPLAEPYGLRAIQDKSIASMEKVYFSVGVAGNFISASAEDYDRLQQGVWKKYEITESEDAIVAEPEMLQAMRKKVRQVNDLPPMPGIAAELVRLKNNPYANASELAAIIEQDPSLSAQLIRYATSPLYGYEGPVDAVEAAIVNVLGMDTVYDIAFGLSLGKAFNNPKEGPLGLNAFWKHALYCASLTQALCNSIEFQRRPPAGVGYLAGLLHNFGILLLGHLFPEQFERLNRAVEQNPDRNIIDIEREVIGVSHTDLGHWLMDAWGMPKEIIEAVAEHHNAEHRGDFATYANLVYIANALLKRHKLGDGYSTEIPAELMQRFGLGELQLEAVLATVLQGQEGLDFMAGKMAA